VRLLLAAGADAKVLVKNTGENALHCVVVGLGQDATPAGTKSSSCSSHTASTRINGRF
jgi:hypothetical protein